MDERQLEDLQRQLTGRSWLYDDPASHRAGVEDAVQALRQALVHVPAPEQRPGAGATRERSRAV